MISRSLLAGIAVLAAIPSVVHPQSFPAEYTLVDRIEGDWLNRNPVPTRPMAAVDGTLWTVNPYLNQIVPITNFTAPGPSPAPVVGTAVFTLPGPVAIASYRLQPSDPWRLLVVCQHANSVAVHDSSTGNMVAVIPVKAQPGDIVVDASNRAFVSCPAADVVVQIDLTNPAFPQTIVPIPARQPTFLALYQNDVLIAPRLSGNGSLVDRKPRTANNAASLDFNEHAGPLGIRDTLLASVADVGLPDWDLFRLNPATGVLDTIARSTGTLLFAHAVQPPDSLAPPGTPDVLWQLNIEANNKDVDAQTEHGIQGNFVFNRLTSITLPASGVVPDPVPSVHTIRHVNDTDPGTEGVQFPTNSGHVLGTPYSLAFTSRAFNGGRCYVAGLLTDNVVAFDMNGNRVGQVFELAAGTMPRQVLVSSDDSVLAIWGHGEVGGTSTTFRGECRVILYRLAAPTTPNILGIGRDPTPHLIRKGRAVFFDASHSLRNDSSCASCHDEGKTDMLAWNLSQIEMLGPDALDDDGFDDKGPMITQTLVGIETAVPFHWRGEQMRGLPDFNQAFADLLGGSQLDGLAFDSEGDPVVTPGSEWDTFERFILSLTEDANQFQNRDRILDNTIDPSDGAGNVITSALARRGQFLFADPTNGIGCIQCHTLPKGTSNEIVNNAFSGEETEKLLWLKSAPFQGLSLKLTQRHALVDFVAAANGDHLPQHEQQNYARIGAGLSHAGVVNDGFAFLLTMVPGTQGDLFQPLRDDVVSFLRQFDSGQAPAVHVATLLNADDLDGSGQWSTAAVTELTYFKTQAEARNCDIAVIGRAMTGALAGPVRGWALRRSSLGGAGLNTMKFKNEFAPLVAAQSTDYFRTQVAAGGWFAVFGLPVGMARKSAIDFDGDELSNGLEPAGGLFDTDTDGDGFWDGLEYNGNGNAGNAGVIPVDTSAPTLVVDPPAFQWNTQKVARLTFETSELSRAVLTLTATGVPTIVVQELTPKIQHDMVVDELRPGIAYTASLTVTDLMVVPNSYTPATFSITSHSLSTLPVNRDSFVVEDLALPAPTPVSGDWQFVGTGRIAIRHANPAATVSVDSVMIVARVLLRRPGDGLALGKPAVDADFVDPNEIPQNAFANPLSIPFRVVDADYTAISPPFVIARTNATGQFNIGFTLEGARILTGDVVTLSIEAATPWLHNENHDMIPGSEVPVMDGNNVNARFEATTADEFVPGFWSFPDTRADDRRKQVTVP